MSLSQLTGGAGRVIVNLSAEGLGGRVIVALDLS
jgi:hypothetical protein